MWVVDATLRDALASYLLMSPPRGSVRGFILYELGILVYATHDIMQKRLLRQHLFASARQADTRWAGLRAVEAAEAMRQEWEKPE